MTGKAWMGGGAAIVALAAAAAWFVHWEGGAYDARLAEAVANPPEGITLVVEELGRTWRTRDYRVRATAGGDRSGLSALWTAHAEMGLGTVTTLHLDLSEGAGALIRDAGVEGFSDELLVKTSATGRLEPVVWRVDALSFRDTQTGLLCRTEPAEIRGGEKPGESWVTASLGGLVCTTPDGKTEVSSLKALRTEVRAVEGRPFVDAAFEGGAFSADGLEGDGFRATFSSKREASGERKDEKSSENAPALWEERLELSVKRPRIEGESADEIGFTARLTGLTEKFIADVSEASAQASTHPAASWKLLGVWQQAFTKGGVSLVLDDARYVRGGDAATLTGRLSYEEDETLPAPRFGLFELAIPQGIAAPESVAEPLSLGEVKLVDGVYRSRIEIDARGVFANGVLIESFGSFGLAVH